MNYYIILIIILIGLILLNNKKEKMTNKIIEPSTEQNILDLNVIEKKNKENLEIVSRKNQQFYFNPINNYTLLNIFTKWYNKQFLPF